SRRAHALVLLAVPDGAVAQVATAIADADARLEPSVSFAHISGALGLDALDALRGRHAVGSFHPLRAIPRPLPPDALNGIVGAVDATKDRPLASVLTGPIRRGDVSTVSRHLEALARLPGSSSDRPSALDLYRMLGAITLQIAREAGLDAAAAERVRRALTPDVAATRRR